MKRTRDIFITGASGTIGRALVEELLSREDGRLFLLLRGKDGLSHEQRAERLLEAAGLGHHLGRRVFVLAGDITEPGMGLTEAAREALRSVEVFHHCAASTRLNGPREECERINLRGTLACLELARELRARGSLQRFVYFSTAYSPGSLQDYHSPEDALPPTAAPANHYEWSKYESESRVREAMGQGLPTVIFRPSIVVGHSRTGEVSEFKVIYPFLRLVAVGLLPALPARRESSLNLVPIDFVARAAVAICGRDDSEGKGFHLVSRTPTTLAMLIDLKDRRYPDAPSVALVEPDQFRLDDLTRVQRAAFEGVRPFLGYLHHELTFDTRNTEAFLQGTDVHWPPVDQAFLEALVDFGVSKGYLAYAGRRGAGSPA